MGPRDASASKNCFELLMTNEIGLDRAPVDFQKNGVFETRNHHFHHYYQLGLFQIHIFQASCHFKAIPDQTYLQIVRISGS